MVAIHRRYMLVLLLIVVTSGCVEISRGDRVLAASTPPVTIGAVTLYNGKHFRFRDCTPLGHPQTAFHSTVRRIFSDVYYSRWQGKHTDRNRWYSPDGRLYLVDNPLVYSGSGPRADCGFIRIAGARGERLLGRWTYQLLVDEKVMYTSRFTLSAAP